MRLRGIRIDQTKRKTVLKSFRANLRTLEKNLYRIVVDGIGLDSSFNWRSHQQLKNLFYDVLRIPPIKKRNTKGVWEATVDRKALEQLEIHFYAEPLINHILALRDIGKKIGVLETDIDPDGRMRTSYNIAGTSTGRFASNLSDFGTGCVLPSAEVLTKNGWIRIDEASEHSLIAQWNDGMIEFVKWKKYVERGSNLLTIKGKQYELTVTKGHRIIYWDYYNKTPRESMAGLLNGHHQIYLPLGGEINGKLHRPAYHSMLMADFSKEPTGWRGSFKKIRKINRFLELANKFGFRFIEQKATEGYRRFYVPGHLDWPKKWANWVLDLDNESAKQLLSEARYWDSHSKGSGFIFFTVDADQASWFATLAHIAGKSATVHKHRAPKNAFAETEMWWVNVKDRDYAQIMPKHWSRSSYNGKVYCPCVPSSFWLVRQNGFISVTGNTNLQNIAELLRSVFIADPGCKFAYIDLEQAESRLVGAIEWNHFYDGRYLDACESGDLHTSVCKQAWKSLPWTGDRKLDRKIADQPFYRQHSYRHMAKILGHASNYNGKPVTVARHTKLDTKTVADFQARYFAAFPAHHLWHAKVASDLRQWGNLTTLTDRKRWFFGRRNDDATIREAIAYDPQGSVGDILNRGMLNVWRANICELLLQIHDAILIQYPENHEDTNQTQQRAHTDHSCGSEGRLELGKSRTRQQGTSHR